MPLYIMNTSSARNRHHLKASMSPLCSFPPVKQQHPMSFANCTDHSTVTCLPVPVPSSTPVVHVSSSSSFPATTTTAPSDGYSTPKSTKLTSTQTQKIPVPSSVGKRKRYTVDENLSSFITPTQPAKRKTGIAFLRKGQWTNTEERLTRLLIEAFEDGWLPVYTGIRLRGYLAVQLQCDPMRVSKKLCAGTIDGKQVPKNYGQKKYRLRKKSFGDADEVEARIATLEKLTKALWSEAHMKKPTFLTLSSTCNLNKRQEAPSSPGTSRWPSPTPKSKKQKVFPIIYLNLSKRGKRYSSVRDNSNWGEPVSSSKDSDSESEPVRLDGESLQAAYDLLTLCSPRGSSSKGRSKKRNLKDRIAKKGVMPNKRIKNNPSPTDNVDDKSSVNSFKVVSHRMANFEKNKPTAARKLHEDESSREVSMGGNFSEDGQ